jgi:hypothetical protein
MGVGYIFGHHALIAATSDTKVARNPEWFAGD